MHVASKSTTYKNAHKEIVKNEAADGKLRGAVRDSYAEQMNQIIASLQSLYIPLPAILPTRTAQHGLITTSY